MTKRTILSIVISFAMLALYQVCATAEPLSGSGTGSVAPAQKRMQEITDAIDKFKDRDYPGALKLLKEAAKKNADLPPANMMLAEFFSEAKVPGMMREHLEQAVVEAPNDPEAYVIMGDIAIRDGRVIEATMLYQKAAELIAKFDKSAKRKQLLVPRILSGLASVAQVRENWAGSQQQLEALLKIDPKNVQAMQRLAYCLFRQKNSPGALEQLRAAAKIDPKMLTPEAVLAQFYAQSDDQNNAKKWFDVALQTAPKDSRTHYEAGKWAFEAGNIAEAKKKAETALQLDPKSMDALMLRGVIALFEKDYIVAERYFEKANLQSPTSFGPRNNLALALIEQKDDLKKRRALENATLNVQQNQKLAEAYATYGWVCYKLNQLDAAEKALNAAVSGGSVSPDTAYYVACLSLDRGRDAVAKQWLQSALNSTAPFSMRPEAKKMMSERFKK